MKRNDWTQAPLLPEKEEGGWGGGGPLVVMHNCTVCGCLLACLSHLLLSLCRVALFIPMLVWLADHASMPCMTHPSPHPIYQSMHPPISLLRSSSFDHA